MVLFRFWKQILPRRVLSRQQRNGRALSSRQVNRDASRRDLCRAISRIGFEDLELRTVLDGDDTFGAAIQLGSVTTTANKVSDEISPDNCRLWDTKTNEKMDKDRFRRDLGKVEEAYQEVAKRLGILPEAGSRDMKGPEIMQ